MGFSRKRELNPNWGKFKNPVIQCVVCKKEFRTRKDKGQECCSLKCRNKFIKGRKRTLESRIKQGKTRTGKYRGKNNPSWKGGVQRGKPKGDWRYYKWYKAVFKRDNFTCISCGERGVYLEAHHIKNWRYNPKLRYKVKNGLTLCKSCHNPTKGLEVEFEPYFEEIIKIVYGGLK